MLHRIERLLREVVAELLVRLVAGEHLVPGDLSLIAVRFVHRAVDHVPSRAPDVGTCAVALDVRNDRVVGNDDAAVLVAESGAGNSGWKAVAHRPPSVDESGIRPQGHAQRVEWPA